MKQLYSICFCIAICFECAAQISSDSTHSFEFVPSSTTKAILYLMNNTSVAGTIVRVSDNNVFLSMSSQTGADSSALQSVAISTIKNIKIKRNAFLLGMSCGIAAGGLVGYGIGYVTYKNDPSISDTENKDKQHNSSFVAGVITAVPGAVIGSIVGTIGTKRNFLIDGQNENIKKMIQTLWELH